jgi:primase-polymerase (primpol)-like protein
MSGAPRTAGTEICSLHPDIRSNALYLSCPYSFYAVSAVECNAVESNEFSASMQNVTLRSAARLEQDQEFEIAKQMQEATNSKNIKIKPVVDESLIGGFIVEWGDNQVRTSAKYPVQNSSVYYFQGK